MDSGGPLPPVPGGYIQLARKLLDSPVWGRDHHYVRLWLYILLKARWREEPEVRGGVTILRGQLLKSFRVIAEENEWGENQRVRRLSTSTIQRILAWFEAQEMIETRGTDLGTLITVRNFSVYQDSDAYRGDLGTDLGTPGEQQEEREEGVELLSPPIVPPSTAAEALDEFCRVVGTPFELKSMTAEDWLLRMAEEFPGVDLTARIRRASEWWDSALATGRKKKCKAPSRAVRVFFTDPDSRKRSNDGPRHPEGQAGAGPSQGGSSPASRFQPWSDDA